MIFFITIISGYTPYMIWEARRREVSMESEGVWQLRAGQGGRSTHIQAPAASAEGTQRRIHVEDERQR